VAKPGFGLDVITLTVSEVAPAGTVTVAGTCANVGFKLFRSTTTPDFPAGAVRVTFNVPELPAKIRTGLTEMLWSSGVEAGGGVIVKLDEVTLALE